MSDKVLKVETMGFPWKTKDPFLFCAHHRDEYPKGNDKMGVEFDQLKGRSVGNDFVVRDGYRMYHGTSIPGFPHHPHRGFETITINKEGFVDHSDSLGAAGRFGEGDVQWMTAGRGVQHSEMFPLIHDDKPNPLEIFQVWLNLPKRSKFVRPHFKMIWKESIPEIIESDEKGRNTTIDLIAGNYKGNNAPKPTPDSWASNPENAVTVLTIKMEPNAIWKVPSYPDSSLNKILYFYKGDEISVDGVKVRNYHSVELDPTQELNITNGDQEAYFMLLQGKPIDEPVVQYGPFVMNTESEIQEAFEDYRRTKFGGWPWPEIEQVHDRNKGRFALHADGSEEIMSD